MSVITTKYQRQNALKLFIMMLLSAPLTAATDIPTVSEADAKRPLPAPNSQRKHQRQKPPFGHASIAGLNGELSLRVNNGEKLVVTGNGFVSFLGPRPEQDSDYHLTISQMPFGQVCAIKHARGQVNRAMRGPSIKCKDIQYFLGGAVKGLDGKLMLQTQWGDIREITSNGRFTMKAPLTMGTPYAVKPISTPSHQTCKVYNGRGIIETQHVNTVQVDCRNRLSVGLD